ncbi:MAG: DUF2786 domain-containing protein [Acidimicrobiales bacterium]
MDAGILERVRKLLAKAESCSSFGTQEGDTEADVFMEKAQQMIAEHAISAALLANGPNRDDIEVRAIVIPAPYAREKILLLNSVAEANRVQVLWRHGDGRGFDEGMCVGFPSDLDAVEVIFTSLLVQSTNEMLAQHYVAKRWSDGTTSTGGSLGTFRRNFLLGFSHRVAERLEEANRKAVQEVQETTGSSVELVLRDRRSLVAEKYAELFPNARTKTTRTTANPEAHQAGYVAGGRADLGQTRVGARKALTR